MNPKVIGRYEIVRELGVGGMGTVFLAHDPRFPRDVALKLLHTELTDDVALRERFEREAQTIASLEHHAIVPVYDFGEYEGQLYLVMRLMGGGTLRDRLQTSPLALKDTIAILQRIASALDKAHEKGIVHRDLKPANILFDDEDKPYLSDFGIVKLYEEASKLTRTGGILGTPAYMSPEQGLGNPVDSRSDIYSLGVVLYEMATGRVPFQADTAIATVLKHVQEPLPSPRSVSPSVSQKLENVIVRAMAKRPENRFTAAGEMAEAIQASRRTDWQDKTLVDAPPDKRSDTEPIPAPQPGRFSRRSLVAAGAGLVLLLAMVAGGWWVASGQDEDTPPRIPPDGQQPVAAVAKTTTPIPSPSATATSSPSASPSSTPTPRPSPTATASPTSSLWVLAPGQKRNQIAFVSNRSGRDAIYALDMSSETVQQITEPGPGVRHWWPAWCGPDRMVFEFGDDPYEPQTQEIWTVDLAADGDMASYTHSGRPAGSVFNGFPSCSPDGRILAFSSLVEGEGTSAFRVGLMELDEGNSRFQRIGDGFPLAGDVSWSADGRSVVFMHYDRDLGNFQIYRLPLSRPDDFENLTALYSGNAKYPDWSAATGQIAFACHEGTGGSSVWHLCATPDTHPDVFKLLSNLHRGAERDEERRVVYHAVTPSWSPDGRAIAYASDVDGDWDIYVYHMDTGRTENLTAGWPSDEMHPNWRR